MYKWKKNIYSSLNKANRINSVLDTDGERVNELEEIYSDSSTKREGAKVCLGKDRDMEDVLRGPHIHLIGLQVGNERVMEK